jgi:uncharacterized membrane protein
LRQKSRFTLRHLNMMRHKLADGKLISFQEQEPEMNRRPHRAAALLLAGLLTVTGTLHFLAPKGFEEIVPRFLGDPAIWVRVSGVAEWGCAAALAMHRSRRCGGIAAAVLFVAVFPANVQMAVDSGGSGRGLLHNPVVAWGRLPLQLPLIMWALYASRPEKGRQLVDEGR